VLFTVSESEWRANQNEQYPGIARAHAPYYWLDSTQLNFRDRTRPTPVCLGKVPWAFGSVVERVVRNERESSRSWDRSPQCPQVFAIFLRFFCLRTLMPICQCNIVTFYLLSWFVDNFVPLIWPWYHVIDCLSSYKAKPHYLAWSLPCNIQYSKVTAERSRPNILRCFGSFVEQTFLPGFDINSLHTCIRNWKNQVLIIPMQGPVHRRIGLLEHFQECQ
jgi:hypothetical protein